MKATIFTFLAFTSLLVAAGAVEHAAVAPLPTTFERRAVVQAAEPSATTFERRAVEQQAAAEPTPPTAIIDDGDVSGEAAAPPYWGIIPKKPPKTDYCGRNTYKECEAKCHDWG